MVHKDVKEKVWLRPNEIDYVLNRNNTFTNRFMEQTKPQVSKGVRFAGNYIRSLLKDLNTIDHTYARFRHKDVDLHSECLVLVLKELNRCWKMDRWWQSV